MGGGGWGVGCDLVLTYSHIEVCVCVSLTLNFYDPFTEEQCFTSKNSLLVCGYKTITSIVLCHRILDGSLVSSGW